MVGDAAEQYKSVDQDLLDLIVGAESDGFAGYGEDVIIPSTSGPRARFKAALISVWTKRCPSKRSETLDPSNSLIL